MKERLKVLIEKNQEDNFAKFELIQELIDDQEAKHNEKQSQMLEHANCLEMLLKILADKNHVNRFCRYADILKVTPVKDEYFTWTTTGKPESPRSENPIVQVRREQNSLLNRENRRFRRPNNDIGSGVVPIAQRNNVNNIMDLHQRRANLEFDQSLSKAEEDNLK